MTDQSQKSYRANSKDLQGCTFLQALEDGIAHYDWLDGQKIDQSLRDRALVSHSVPQERAKELTTTDTFGPLFGGSLPNSDLQRSLASRLMERVDLDGSPEYKLTWRRWVMKSGFPAYRLQVSARRTSGTGCSGWHNPTANDSKQACGPSQANRNSPTADAKKVVGWPTPNAMEGGQTSRGGDRKGEMLIGGHNFWSASTFIPCADGKWRRVPGGVGDTNKPRCETLKSKRVGEEAGPEQSKKSSVYNRVPGGVADLSGSGQLRAEGDIDKKEDIDARRRHDPADIDRGERSERLEIESPIFAMVDGLRSRMGNSWNPGIIEALNCFPLADGLPGRVGLLRGAGNSIVPQAAAEFIKAFMEVMGE